MYVMSASSVPVGYIQPGPASVARNGSMQVGDRRLFKLPSFLLPRPITLLKSEHGSGISKTNDLTDRQSVVVAFADFGLSTVF